MQLSPHFTLAEFEYSSTALARGIDNRVPLRTQADNALSGASANEAEARFANAPILNNLKNLCLKILEPLREHVGGPVRLSSGYRCPALNRAVGGKATSQHLTGEAADIRVPDPATGEAWFRWMRDHLPFDQLIKERSSRSSPSFWIHVSCRLDPSKNRRQVIAELIK